MQLVTIEMEVPKIIQEVDRLIKKLANESVIAGGCLSDSYMGLKYKDIDVFVKGEIDESKLRKIFGIKPEKVEVNFEDYESFTGKTNIYKFVYKGQKIEIIEVGNLRRVYDFDFRFRQLYYKDGVVKGSVGAIEDMEKKRLVLVNPYSSISTLCRMVYFERKYGFKVERKSYEFLLTYINNLEYDLKKALKVVQNNERLTEYEREKLLRFLKKSVQEKKIEIYDLFDSQIVKRSDGSDKVLYFKDVSFPFDPHLKQPLIDFIAKCAFDIRYDAGLLGAQYEKIREYTFQKPIEPFEFRMKKEWNLLFYQNLKQSCEELFKKERLRLITSGIGNDVIHSATKIFKKEITENTMKEFIDYGADEIIKLLEKILETKENWDERGEIYKKIDQLKHLHYSEKCYFLDSFPEENKNRLGDIIKNNTFCVGVYEGQIKEWNRLSTLVFRRCTNRKYTIGYVTSLRQGHTWLITLNALKALEERYPNLITSGNEGLVGVYDLFTTRSDYYFDERFANEGELSGYLQLIEESGLELEMLKRNIFVPFIKK